MTAFQNFQRPRRRGATLILICILMVVLIGMVAFAVDVGRMYLVRAQLQSAVDSGALAATLQLKEDKDDLEAAVAAAEEFVQFNRVGWLAKVPRGCHHRHRRHVGHGHPHLLARRRQARRRAGIGPRGRAAAVLFQRAGAHEVRRASFGGRPRERRKSWTWC